MRFQHYKRENTIGTHNFDSFKMYVGTLSNPRGEIFKGITILWAGSACIAAHLPLSEETALEFANYLDSVIEGELPSKYKVTGYGRELLNILNVFTHEIF